MYLILLHSERPKLCTILVFLSAVGLRRYFGILVFEISRIYCSNILNSFPAVDIVPSSSFQFADPMQIENEEGRCCCSCKSLLLLCDSGH